MTQHVIKIPLFADYYRNTISKLKYASGYTLFIENKIFIFLYKRVALIKKL